MASLRKKVARGIKQYGAAIRHNFKVRQNQGRKTDSRKHFITQEEKLLLQVQKAIYQRE